MNLPRNLFCECFDWLKLPGPALLAALRRTTPEVVRSVGAYDAVVVGAGATGSFAAMLLAEAGLRVLVLDAGSARSRLNSIFRRLKRGILNRTLGPAIVTARGRKRQPVQSHCYAWSMAPDAFVDDLDCPYITAPGHPFVWLRSRQLGGRMTIPGHGRQYYRFGPSDFAPSDGLSSPWPMQPNELDSWYAVVEGRLGLSGSLDKVPWLPDSQLSYVIDPTPAETMLQQSVHARWPGVRPVLGRFAPPFDALEVAARTGRLLIRRDAIVREIGADGSGRVDGVRFIDRRSGAEARARAPIVFLCASALESTRLLLLSRPPRSPNGLGAASGALGRYLMDHVRIRAEGTGPALLPGPAPAPGRCIYLPRFDARDRSTPQGRGFGVQVDQRPINEEHSYFAAASFGEMLPRQENLVTLDADRRDAWGISVLRIDCAHGREELARAREQAAALRELAEVADVTLSLIDETPAPPGSANHECGTARMGDHPANSVLDPHNECWEAKGLYLTDGACFPSQGTQNPTLTLLALTARACDYAARTARCN